MKLDNREVRDITLYGIDRSDYPDFVDAYVGQAFWDDTGIELTESEIDRRMDECAGEVQEMALLEVVEE